MKGGGRRERKGEKRKKEEGKRKGEERERKEEGKEGNKWEEELLSGAWASCWLADTIAVSTGIKAGVDGAAAALIPGHRGTTTSAAQTQPEARKIVLTMTTKTTAGIKPLLI